MSRCTPLIRPRCTRWLLSFALIVLANVPTKVVAQASSAPPVSPQVQQLYAQAKAAQSGGDDATAIAKYREILKLSPRLAPAYNNLGMLYFNNGDFARAVEVLEQGIKLNPNMPSASAMLGAAYYEMGDNARARTALEAALRSNPHDDRAEMMLARSLINVKNYKAAAGHLQNLTQRTPQDQEAWYLLGKAYLALSQDALGMVNQIDPNSVLSHEIAGEIDESMNNLDGALVEYQKAADMAPQQTGTHYHLGNAYAAMGKWDSAIEEFEAELKNDPHNCTARWRIGNSMLEKNAPTDQVLPVLNQAIDQCPSLMQARVDRARALVKLNRPDDAVSDLAPAAKESPDEPSIHFLLASAYRAQGKTAEAQAEMQIYANLQRSASAATAEHASEAMTLKSKAH